MPKMISQALVVLLITIELYSCFKLRPLSTLSHVKKGLFASSTVGRAEWTDDESLSSSREISYKRKLPAAFVNNLDFAVGTLITRCALNTVSFYMLEFHDEVNEKWMMGFGNYRKNGDFPGGLWTNYIEKMIQTDKLRLEVLMPATTAALKSRKIPVGANVMMQYFHELEPRKIAHQIITVREDVSSEMIQDLGCTRLENEEAIRFAYTWARDGREAAEQSRKVTRMCEHDMSTPKRDFNYMNFNIMLSALALELVRNDLIANKDHASIQILDDLTTTIGPDDGSVTMKERLHQERFGPRSFMEQLYHKGIAGGITKPGVKPVNTLKVAESFFDARMVVSREISKQLSLQSMQNRHYYKLIKDSGGFQKLDMSSGIPKITFIDLDQQAKEDSLQAAQDLLDDSKKEAESAALPITQEKESPAAVSNEEESTRDTDSEPSGPMMM